jgi:hypothetical protein
MPFAPNRFQAPKEEAENGDLLPDLSTIIRRVCSGYARPRGVLRPVGGAR